MQAYKHWLMDHSLEDSFESLIECVEIRVQIVEETREQTSQKDEEKVFEVSEFAAEPSTPNRSQGAVLWRRVNRTILYGFVKPSKSYLF